MAVDTAVARLLVAVILVPTDPLVLLDLTAAEMAAKRAPSEHADRTAMPFVTLVPARCP